MNEIIPSSAVQVHDEECEKYVIGTIMSSHNALAEVREFVDDDSFYVPKHQQIWRAIVSLDEQGIKPDLITVYGELQSMGMTEIPVYELGQIGTNTIFGSLVPHALRLQELAARRKMWMLGHRLVSAGSTEVDDIDEIREHLKDSLDNMFTSASENVFTLEDTSKMLYELVNKNMSGGEELTGTPTGFSKIDKKGGFQTSDLVIIAGETSQGKTSLANSIILNSLQKGAKIAFYSMEMTRVQLTARMAAMMSGISSSDILYSTNLSHEQLNRFDNALGALSKYSLYFDDKSTSNIESILASIRAMKMKYDIDGVVVDYLQILNVNSKNNNKEQAMGEAARKLKNIAKDLGIWVIALSQLNRDAQNPQPNLNRLRDSGQIAEAADMVMFVYRPEYYGKKFPEPFENEDVKGKAMIDIAKGRNIGTMRFLTYFHAPLTLFEDIREGETINPPSDMPF